MNHLEHAGRRENINPPVIEEIRDYDNTTLRDLLEESGMATAGDVISQEDFGATRQRAEYLSRQAGVPASANSFLLAAFRDRMRHVDKMGHDAYRRLPKETLKTIVYVDTGLMPTDEELEQAMNSPLPFEEWESGWTEAKRRSANEFDVAVNKEGNILGRGESPQDALRDARKKTGG